MKWYYKLCLGMFLGGLIGYYFYTEMVTFQVSQTKIETSCEYVYHLFNSDYREKCAQENTDILLFCLKYLNTATCYNYHRKYNCDGYYQWEPSPGSYTMGFYDKRPKNTPEALNTIELCENALFYQKKIQLRVLISFGIISLIITAFIFMVINL